MSSRRLAAQRRLGSVNLTKPMPSLPRASPSPSHRSRPPNRSLGRLAQPFHLVTEADQEHGLLGRLEQIDDAPRTLFQVDGIVKLTAVGDIHLFQTNYPSSTPHDSPGDLDHLRADDDVAQLFIHDHSGYV